MPKKDKIPSIVPLYYKYPLLSVEQIPNKYKLFPISFKNDEIEEYGVLFFHRLLKKYYGNPSDIEWLEIKREKRENGSTKMGGIGKEWKYYFRTPSGGIIQIGTAMLARILELFHVLPENITEPNEKLIKEGRKFVADLLMWAARLKGQILNPKKEFEEGKGIKLYLLNNVFRLNYDSAELMLEDAEGYEDEIYTEYKKYLPEIHKDDPKKHAYIDKYFAGLGMYYGSIISYYFMAFEGFVNLLYHAFLKEELRDQKLDQRLERLDLDWKILFMPALCNGFKSEPINSESDIFKNFLKLRDYRNQIFHSKIGDSLKSVAIVETGFLYACDLEKYNKGLFPSQKRGLKKEDVLRVKNIVDELIKEILSKMNDKSKKLVDEYLMKGLAVPFWVDETGKIRFGKLREDHDLDGEK